MGLERVVVAINVRIKLAKLVRILYQKEYFGFWDSAEKYVDSIYQTIYKIPDLKYAKGANTEKGAFYIRHKAHKNTTYYIFFDKKGNRYLVRNVLTNHEQEYEI